MDVRELFRNLKKEAECPLCLETVKDPKTLPCLHSFCLVCLDKHALYARQQLQTTIKCPVCLTCFQMPEGDTFGGLPTSFHLNRLVDVLALGDDNLLSQTCSSCEENNTATCYCFDCSDFFCDVCAKFHSKMKISRHHRSVLIQNLKTQDVEELMHRPVMCGEKYHEKETLEYYCQECKVCICHKCVILNHNRHAMVDIREAAEEQKMQITEVVEQAKIKIAHFEMQVARETELFNKSREDTQAARDKVRTTIDELIRIFKEHEMTMAAKLDEADEERQRCHTEQQERVQSLATQLKSSVEYCEAVLQRNLSFEILQTQQTLIQRCEILLNKEEVNVKKPMYVNYVTNEKDVKDLRQAVPGRVVVSWTDSSKSVAEGKGLEEAEVGREANFTITTKDSKGKQCYNESDQLAITIKTGEERMENAIQDKKNGEYTVTYAPHHCADEHTVIITLNGQRLTGSPWCVQVYPYQYKTAIHYGSFGHGVQGIAFSEVSKTIAVADSTNCRVQLFDTNATFLYEFQFNQHENRPTSVAFTSTGDVVVVHGCRISLFTERLRFIECIAHAHAGNPQNLSVACDGRMIVTYLYNKAVTVLSPDGTELLLTFTAPDCHVSPCSAVYHRNMFFVSYQKAHCIKVFNEEGVFLYDIGTKGSGDGQLHCPSRLAIDKFNNLIVCDKNNSRLQFFTLGGKFVNSTLTRQFNRPCAIATSNSGYVIVTYDVKNAHVKVFH
ncbi:tripartite motif-containing protein 2-like [Orbicella faveolata]|uniref:tripartite motif-containing protein 2-like n=1 Tax=Orbicella faveolata TaxID=48498 RepID=UPI0009E41A19|nr:tripartite motif-containing protein 2-like [Orbicella faveolata]